MGIPLTFRATNSANLRTYSKPGQLNLTATVFPDDLVARCKEGDTSSYTLLYQQYCRAMYNTSLRIVNNTADAEDVLQEAFLAAFRLEQFDYSSTFGSWLKRIVINKSIDLLRKKRVKIVEIGPALEEETGDVQPEGDNEEEVQLKVESIRLKMGELPTGYRTVLSLRLFEQYDYEEIAEIMHISPVTVRTQYHRAKTRLLALLKKGGQNE
jgi:RNA polymerase sigma-70 factor (ECF subfamily)